jgi:3-deoxy-D-manno-octulosonate 8-phosphate phosphatase (KDO 8-P phosphatase)
LTLTARFTDGKIYISASGELMKAFNVKDGYGLAHILPTLGVTPIIVTGHESLIVQNRARELGITEVYQNIADKAAKSSVRDRSRNRAGETALRSSYQAGYRT